LSTYHATVYSCVQKRSRRARKMTSWECFVHPLGRVSRSPGSRFQCSPVVLKTADLLCHGKTYKVI
jgi:hypothetical protein